MISNLAEILGGALKDRASSPSGQAAGLSKFERTPDDILMRKLNPLIGGTVGPRKLGGYVPGGIPQAAWGNRFIDQARQGRGAMGNTTTYSPFSSLPSWWR